MKRSFKVIAVLAIIAFIIGTVLFTSGAIKMQNFNVSEKEVDSIEIFEGNYGGKLIITAPNDIKEILRLINSSGPCIGTPNQKNGWLYSMRLKNNSGAAILDLTVVSASKFIADDGYVYSADTSAFIEYLESLDWTI